MANKKVVIEGKGAVILRTTIMIPDDEIEEFLGSYDDVLVNIDEDDVVCIEDIDITSLKVNGIETDIG